MCQALQISAMSLHLSALDSHCIFQQTADNPYLLDKYRPDSSFDRWGGPTDHLRRGKFGALGAERYGAPRDCHYPKQYQLRFARTWRYPPAQSAVGSTQ